MSGAPAERRFADALQKALADWAAADAAACAARAGCECTAAGVLVPFFGTPHLVSHPAGEVTIVAESAGEQAADGSARPGAGRPPHVTVVVLLLHYLLTAGGAPPAGRMVAYRELPGCLFYAAAFSGRAEAPLTRAFGGAMSGAAGGASGAAGLTRAAAALGGTPLEMGDAAFSFAALPRLPMAVTVWEGDDEEPGEARVLFDAEAAGYLPPEDLAGLGGYLAHALTAAATA